MLFELWASVDPLPHNSNNIVPNVTQDAARAIALVCFAALAYTIDPILEFTLVMLNFLFKTEIADKCQSPH